MSDAAPIPFERGTLWQCMLSARAAATESGALCPITTSAVTLEDQRMRFLVRIVDRARKERTQRAAAGRHVNPFLPFDPRLYVAHARPAHVCLLNKFCVFDHHLLLVTREFECQQSPLTQDDFDALASCLNEFDCLAFYNSGAQAGASQPHKHLQMVRLPFADSRLDPLDPLDGAEPGTGIALPFTHAAVPLAWDSTDTAGSNGQALFSAYHQLLRSLELNLELRPPPAYNMLVTRSWMSIVPRRRECFRDISLNALAFAGAFLVRNHEQLQTLRELGPLAALCHTAGRV